MFVAVELIETHAHLTSLGDKPLEEVFANARRCSVSTIIAIGASDGVESAAAAVRLAETYDHVFATVGVHPHDAGSVSDLSALEPLAAHPKVVAIGETGLDFFRDWAPKDRQQSLFEQTIALARACKKPLVIHCRDAADDVLQTLIRGRASEVGGVFHCYAEDAEFAKRLRDINFRVSFTGNLTFKKATALRDAARAIPLDQMMVETDCPYMAPEPFRGGPSEPMHVYQVAAKIAEIKDIPLEEAAAGTTATAKSLFSLP